MIGYTLTIEQKEAIQGVEYAPFQSFNCVQDIDGTWFLFLSEQDKTEITGSQWAYLLDLPESEYVPPPPPDPFNGQS